MDISDIVYDLADDVWGSADDISPEGSIGNVIGGGLKHPRNPLDFIGDHLWGLGSCDPPRPAP